MLPRVCGPDARPAPGRCSALRVRAAAASRGRDARGQEPCLAARHDRARPGAVRGRALDRVGRRDHPTAGAALAGPYTQLEQCIKTASLVNIDETGWKTGGGNRTLWAALTGSTAVFRVAAGRHAFEARTLLGERFAGIVCSDRWRGYDYLDPSQRQLCWAHLLRDFTAHSEGMADQEQFGCGGLVIAHDLFAAWDSYQQDGDRDRLQARTAPLQDKLRTLLEHAARTSPRTKYHRQFAKNLLNRWPALWTFTHTDGVEPTNNHAERGLRGAVIYRKLSLGSQSEHGERTIERLLSASITCRLRNQSLFAYLTQALAAHARGDPVPALT